jgi:hypothetical protein
MNKRLGRLTESSSDLAEALDAATDGELLRDIHYNLACIHAMRGDHEGLIAHLRGCGPREVELVKKHFGDYFKKFSQDPDVLRCLEQQGSGQE